MIFQSFSTVGNALGPAEIRDKGWYEAKNS